MIDHLILTAVQSECDPFLKLYPKHTPCETQHQLRIHPLNIGHASVALCVAGIGTSFTSMVAGTLLSELKPKHLWFSGTCGGISPEVQLGDIVIGTAAFEVEIQNLNQAFADTPFEEGLTHPSKQQVPPLIYPADAQIIQQAQNQYAGNPQVHFGKLASSNLFPSPPSLFKTLKEQNTLAIDMETSALYQLGWLMNVPTLAVRCVSNCLNAEGDDPNISEATPNEAADLAAKRTVELIKSTQ